MYVAVKGGEKAIKAAHNLLALYRRGNNEVLEIEIKQIKEQLSLAVDRVMAEGSLYIPDLAALAIKQAQGDLVEAIFLLRAMRTSLARFGDTLALDTSKMRIKRRISATWKDLPGGQILGPTYDYTHRLLDTSLMNNDNEIDFEYVESENVEEFSAVVPRALDVLKREDIIEPASREIHNEPKDITRSNVSYPTQRCERLQNLARADEGFLLALAYSTQRGFGNTHPFVGEIRQGSVPVSICPEELGFEINIGEIAITECETVNKFSGGNGVEPCFTRGYGLSFGNNERKAMSMALVDRTLRTKEFDEAIKGPAQMEEFVLEHSDNVAASGFVQHLKLPHYVDFQAEISMIRDMREERKTNEQ